MNYNKYTILDINISTIEGFLYNNFLWVFPILIATIIVFFTKKYFFNFKYKCPNCSMSSDISRIKKNEFFRKFKFTENIRKFNCRKCHYKFYILNKAQHK